MKSNIITDYSENVLKPIEQFIQKQEIAFYLKNQKTIEREKILEKTQDFYLEKLEKFAQLCDTEFENQNH